MYGLGLYRVIGLDFRDNRPKVPTTLRKRLQRRKDQLNCLRDRLRGSREERKRSSISLRSAHDLELAIRPTSTKTSGDILGQRPLDAPPERSNPSEPEIMPVLSRNVTATSIDVTIPPAEGKEKLPEPAHAPYESVRTVVMKRIKAFASPPTIGVLVSLVFALVPPLKALMVPVEGWSGVRIGNAPDGGAPLAFLYDVRFHSPLIS